MAAIMTERRCPRCNMPVSATSQLCGQCGFVLVQKLAPEIRRAQAGEKAVASLVLGILGIIGAVIPLLTVINLFVFLLLAVLPVFGLVSANRAKASLPSASPQVSLANAGFTISVIALVIDGFLLLFLLSGAIN